MMTLDLQETTVDTMQTSNLQCIRPTFI